MVMLPVFTLILLIGFVAARRQDHINRAMTQMQDPDEAPTGYVGPHLPGPS
jgi:hypothetical protein